MLTPIEIQGITFKAGRGYKKEDVDSFMKALYHDYEIMYKENKELKDKVSTLSDGVQYYKNLEKTLQKALVLAEKTSEETKEAAKKQADVLESEARIKAKQILMEARQEYNKIEAMTHELMQNFKLYKAQFKQIASAQLEVLESDTFEIRQRTVEFELEKEEEDTKLDFEKVLNIDKVEEKASDEEKIQSENLIKQVNDMEEKSKSVDKDDSTKETVYKDEEFKVNLDGILEEKVSDNGKDSVVQKDVYNLGEKNETNHVPDEESLDTQTDLEIKMLQKLLNEIKKNNELATDDNEFEFINTDSDD